MSLLRAERHPNWRGDAISFTSLHRWLRWNYRKSGVCVVCRREGKTQWALRPGMGEGMFPHGDQLYPGSRDIARYVELCPSCHKLYGEREGIPCLVPRDTVGGVVEA